MMGKESRDMGKKTRKILALVSMALLLIAVISTSISVEETDNATTLLTIAFAVCLSANLLGDLLQVDMVKSLEEKDEKKGAEDNGKENE